MTVTAPIDYMCMSLYSYTASTPCYNSMQQICNQVGFDANKLAGFLNMTVEFRNAVNFDGNYPLPDIKKVQKLVNYFLANKETKETTLATLLDSCKAGLSDKSHLFLRSASSSLDYSATKPVSYCLDNAKGDTIVNSAPTNNLALVTGFNTCKTWSIANPYSQIYDPLAKECTPIYISNHCRVGDGHLGVCGSLSTPPVDDRVASAVNTYYCDLVMLGYSPMGFIETIG